MTPHTPPAGAFTPMHAETAALERKAIQDAKAALDAGCPQTALVFLEAAVERIEAAKP